MNSETPRILFFSDAHGVFQAMKALRARVEVDAPDLVCFLGDALYHGPRNGVPLDYDTQCAADEFNAMSERIVAVRGNCDAEVDQMMFEFPMMGDYAVLEAEKETFFLTHGHLWNEHNLPPLGMGSVLAHGHTHVPELTKLKCGLTVFNPGSVALPKGGSSRSFGYFDGESLKHYTC